MGRLLLMVLVAGMLAPIANAEPLPGFRESSRLTPRASMIVGKPVRVYCAVNPTLWGETAARMVRGGGGSVSSGGFAIVGGTEAYLAPRVCQALERWLRGKPVPFDSFAGSLGVLIHESVHLRGVDDERDAGCLSVGEASRWGRVLFGVKQARMKQLTLYVRVVNLC